MIKLINILREVQINSSEKWKQFNIGDRVTFNYNHYNPYNIHWIIGKIKNISYMSYGSWIKVPNDKNIPKDSMVKFTITLEDNLIKGVLGYNNIVIYYTSLNPIGSDNVIRQRDKEIFNSLKQLNEIQIKQIVIPSMVIKLYYQVYYQIGNNAAEDIINSYGFYRSSINNDTPTNFINKLSKEKLYSLYQDLKNKLNVGQKIIREKNNFY